MLTQPQLHAIMPQLKAARGAALFPFVAAAIAEPVGAISPVSGSIATLSSAGSAGPATGARGMKGA